MTSPTFFIPFMRFVVIGTLLLLFSVPVSTSAATAKPTCSLTVTTKEGKVEISSKKGNILVHKGDDLQIAWESKNAKTASNTKGDDISLSGTEKFSPNGKTSYSYRFKSGSRSVTCAVTANVITGSIDDFLFTSNSSKSTLSGTAVGTKTVQVVIRKEGSTATLYKSKVIKVKSGKWKAEISKALSDGTYNIEISGPKNIDLNIVARGTLTILGKEAKITSATASAATTLVVSSVPLLSGGVARAGASVPVSYLQITNVGKEPASLKGFWVKQNGSAPVESVIGFTTVDDMGGSRGASQIVPGSALFKNGLAFAPTDAIFAPGQMRLFTIKAVLTGNVSSYLGKQLMIDVASIDTNASAQGLFPIRGTTWTIVY